MSFTSPSVSAQETVIKKITCEEDVAVDYIETHGTGTKLGAPIELKALYNAYKNSYERIPIGNVKANLGHLDVVAGITSVVKALYMFQENIIPANVNLSRLNNNLEKYQNIFYFPATNISKKLNKIAISSFGIGGTNTPLILKRYENELMRLIMRKMLSRILFTHFQKEPMTIGILSFIMLIVKKIFC